MRDVIVVDNFLSRPEDYRRAALEMQFQTFEFEHCRFHGIAPMPPFNPASIRACAIFPQFTPTLSFFRRSPEGQEEPHFIHTDVDMGDWSCILYLNPKPPVEDGTSFWTHEATGAIESDIPHERSYEGRSPEGWKLRRRVMAAFNRAVIFPSTYFHSRSIFENWSAGDEARLTQITFGTGAMQ